MHIIELSGTDRSSRHEHISDDDDDDDDNIDNDAATVEVDIGRQRGLSGSGIDGGEGSSNNGRMVTKNVLLVLHAPYPVRWRVRSHGVRGKLTVVVSVDQYRVSANIQLTGDDEVGFKVRSQT